MNFKFLAIVLLGLLSSTNQLCKNNTEIRYSLQVPSQITNYYSLCSEFTGRTCCSPKNIQALAKKVRKAIDSPEMSPSCKERISRVSCSLCDGDWGQGYYEGVCGSYCFSIYDKCSQDYFVVDSMNNKIRACRETDFFCWKLKDIMKHFQIQPYKQETNYLICKYFDIPASQEASPCWSGEISSSIRGKPKKIIDFAKSKRKKAENPFYAGYEKQIMYGGIIGILAAAVAYKLRPNQRRPHYYRLN